MSPVRRFFVPVKGLAGPCRQRGVTLIELMVALVIGLLVTAAMLKVYVDASRMYRFNEGLARVQENGRFAIEFTRRAARVAGFWGCYSELSINNHISTGAASLIGTTHQPGIIANGGHVTGTDNDGLNGSDSVTFRGAAGSGVPFPTSPGMSSPGDNIPVTNTAPFDQSPLPAALISDCETVEVFQITGPTPMAGSALEHGEELSKIYQQSKKPVVFRAESTTFCIALGADASQPALRRLTNPTSGQTCANNGDELVEGIENMQVLYGEDTDANIEGADGDRTANRYVPFGTDGLDMDRVVSVRISLLVRSLNDNLTTNPSPYTYDSTATTPADRYLRKVFTSTITLRNKAG